MNEQPKVVDEVKTAPINLDALIKLGILEKELEPIPGLRITMHVLIQSERESVAKLMPVSAGTSDSQSFYTASESEKVPTLTYAITKIDQEEYKTEEQKATLQSKLSQAPSIAIDLIYLAYSKLCIEQLTVLSEGLKKKS